MKNLIKRYKALDTAGKIMVVIGAPFWLVVMLVIGSIIIIPICAMEFSRFIEKRQ